VCDDYARRLFRTATSEFVRLRKDQRSVSAQTVLRERAQPSSVAIEATPEPRRRRVAAWEVGVLVAYAALLVFALAHHERWFDEAQAWVLGRDASIRDLLVRYPRYEGSPPLWQLLVAVPAKLGAPFWTISVISGVVAFFGAALIVLRSPFPPVLRSVLPFTYWLFFQHGVVARSYVLIGPLLWLLALAWPRRYEHPVRLGLLLGGLSLVSFHGYLIAATVLAVHGWQLLSRWRRGSASFRRGQVWLLAGFGALSVLLFLQLRTPPDISTHASFNANVHGVVNVARAMTTGAFANRLIILGAVAATLVWLLRARRFSLWLLPTAAVLGFSAVRYGNVWHQGVLVEIWMFALWVSFGDDSDLPSSPRDTERWRAVPIAPWVPAIVTVAVLGALSVQLVWTAKTVRYDAAHTYSAAAQTAAYIKTLGAPDVVMKANSPESTALQPYFASNPFVNINHGKCPCFWWWSKNADFDKPIAHLATGHPAAIVFGDKVGGHPHARSAPHIAGYRVARYFTGALYIRNEIFEHEGFWVLVPDDAAAS
jgi:hypothetical protein